jgi:hypothetical protein
MMTTHRKNNQTRPGLSPQKLVGKKITKVNNEAFNAWGITFEDGTELWLDTEKGLLGIPGLVVNPPEGYK